MVGRVMDVATAKAVEGARVRCLEPNGPMAVSDSVGAYELEGLPHSCSIEVSRMGYAPAGGSIHLDEEIVTRDWQLEKGVAIAGWVRENGIGRAMVDVRIAKTPGSVRSGTTAATDSEGAFRFVNVSKGLWMARAQHGAKRAELQFWALNGENELVLDLTPRQGRKLEGRVVDPNGRGVLGAMVDSPDAESFVYSDEYGAFELSVEDVSDDLWVSAPGYLRRSVKGNESQRIEMQRAGKVRGRVMDTRGVPLDVFRIRLVSADMRAGERSAQDYGREWVNPGVEFCGTGGYWTTEGENLTPGSCIGVAVESSGYYPARLERVIVPDHQSTEETIIVLRSLQ